jgi:hypothetical protein
VKFGELNFSDLFFELCHLVLYILFLFDECVSALEIRSKMLVDEKAAFVQVFVGICRAALFTVLSQKNKNFMEKVRNFYVFLESKRNVLLEDVSQC